MCGIYGAIGTSSPQLRDLQPEISGALRHRGPDDEGFADGLGWALGFRRLSILDLTASGHQPMTTPDRRYWLVFNGEIYNYLELKRELERAGEVFTGTSDSEVLLRLLARQGAQALHRLNGMFAFAYIDTATRRFMIARDRLGVKPLYMYRKGGEVRFASELKALLLWPGAPREISRESLAEYVALNYLPSEQCIFKDYSKLPPAHYLAGSLDSPGNATTVSYWDVELNDDPTSRQIDAAALEELEALLADATRIRLRSDVPVGIFLSGGIDSGLVAVLASKTSSNKPLALTVAFDHEEHDETDLAKTTASTVGLPQQVISHSAGDLSAIDQLAWYFDEPFGDSSALPMYMLCRAASAHATVFLSGDGGDEAFGGYRRYIETSRRAALAGMLRPIHGLVRTGATVLSRTSRVRYRLTKAALRDDGYAAAFDGIPNDPILSSIAGDEIRGIVDAGQSLWNRWSATAGQNILARQQKLDYSHYLPDDVLVKVDRASMANSIEVRSPFLDYRLVEWAARLPRGVMLDGMEGKIPLRQLASRLLPQSVSHSRKRGFSVPLDYWFRMEAGATFAEDRLLSRRALERGWWDAKGVRTMLDTHRQQSGRQFGTMIWRLLMLDAWARRYADGVSLRLAPAPERRPSVALA